MKGALVELVSGISGSVPNVIIFQYNPETLRHTLAQALAPAAPTGQATANALAVGGVPTETFSFSLSLDATDQIADRDPRVSGEAIENGIYARLAALELLMYPVGGSGSTSGGSSGGTSGGGTSGGGEDRRPTPASQLPVVLFVWGTGRILPVRVTSLSITEKLYDEKLNPTSAEAQLELRVLTPDDLRSVPGRLGELATAAYAYSQGQRTSRAASNLGATERNVIGILGDKHLVP